MKKLFNRKIIFILFLILAFSSCSEKNKNAGLNKNLEIKMNNIAEEYVKLVLKIGQYDPDYIDAYFGPKEGQPEETALKYDSTAIQNLYDEAGLLLDSLDNLKGEANEIETLRFKYLYKQLLSARAKLFMIAGGRFSFDQEAKALYDAEPPIYPKEHFQKIINELDKILPGKGSVAERLKEFKKDFIIPNDKLEKVLNTTIEEARKRTLQHIKLPNKETFKLEFVTNKSWGGYNWYKGNYFSLIQVNTDLPIYIDRAIDLACHEGYPGHHVYNILLEQNLYKKLGWIEFSVYVLFSPQSLIAEGTANYGVEVDFPGNSKLKFEKEILYPLAGLDSSKADEYNEVLELTSQLNYSNNEAARNYLNGTWDKDQTIEWLKNYSLRSQESAEKYLSFIKKYRSYVINYNLGKDIVKNYIEKNGGTAEHPEKRWELFEKLISTPQTASNLAE